MNILITGSKGFVGKNLVAELNNDKEYELFGYDIDSGVSLLDKYTKECDFVFHLAGVNRPLDEDEFMKGNFGFTNNLLNLLKKHNNKSPIVLASSVQAEYDNPYGKSKKAGEDLLFEYSKETGSDVFIYRLTNLFGKWSRPNYNTVVATFCNNIARNIDIKINNSESILNLCYIDDVIKEFKKSLIGKANKKGDYFSVDKEYKVTLGKLAEMLISFKESRNNKFIPNMSDEFTKKLYATYLSFLPEDQFSYDLVTHKDYRGSFTEFVKSKVNGQVSVNVSKSGITKGEHWHSTKNEKFLVVSGSGIVRFRKVGDDKIIEYNVSGEKLKVVDIPTGYTHSIVNTGTTDMITIIWASEPFDPDNMDTYFLEVD